MRIRWTCGCGCKGRWHKPRLPGAWTRYHVVYLAERHAKHEHQYADEARLTVETDTDGTITRERVDWP